MLLRGFDVMWTVDGAAPVVHGRLSPGDEDWLRRTSASAIGAPSVVGQRTAAVAAAAAENRPAAVSAALRLAVAASCCSASHADTRLNRQGSAAAD
jgi:hypothetical protein